MFLENKNYKLSQCENIRDYNIYMKFGIEKLDIDELINIDISDAINKLKMTINNILS